MPDNPNPYMDPNFDPNGYVPNNGPMGFVDETDPYTQQGNWNQGQAGAMPGQGFPPDGMQGNGYYDDFVSPGNMMSAQDIYANQAAMNGGMPPAPGAPDFGGMGADGFYDPYQVDEFGNPIGGGAFPGQQFGAPGFDDPFSMDPYGNPMGAPAVPGVPGAQPNIFEQPTHPGQSGPIGQPGQPIVPNQGIPAVPTPTEAPAQMPNMPNVAGASNAAQAPNAAAAQAAAAQVAENKPQDAAARPAQDKQGQPQGGPNRPPQGQRRPGPRRPSMPINPALARPGRAKMALVLAILSIVFSLIAPVGFVLSLFAMHIATSYKRNGGRASAGDAAKIFSVVGLIFSSLMLALIVWFIGYYLGYAEWSFMFTTPITYFNNSPIGQIFSLPVPST